MSMDSTSALNSAPGVNQNHRIAHIRRFACNPHTAGEVLRVITLEETPTVLGEWSKSACADNASLALEIDLRLQEHADTVADTITANLVWCSLAGAVIEGKRVKYRPTVDTTGMDPDQAAQAQALGIDGTERGRIVQIQREREYAMRSYFSAHQTQIAQATAHSRELREFALMQSREYREHAQMLAQMLQQSWQANHTSQVELDRLRQQQRTELDRMHLALRQAADEVSEAQGDEGAAADDPKAQLYSQVGKALEVAMPFIAQAIMQKISAAPPGLAQPADNDNAAASTPSPSSAAAGTRRG